LLLLPRPEKLLIINRRLGVSVRIDLVCGGCVVRREGVLDIIQPQSQPPRTVQRRRIANSEGQKKSKAICRIDFGERKSDFDRRCCRGWRWRRGLGEEGRSVN
jgi:hypothetical protein